MITVNDIREKEFSRQKHGYHEDEVDDFLDKIADQMEVLIRENKTLLTQLDDAKAAAAAQPVQAYQSVPQPVPVAVPTPVQPEHPVDEPSYFKNLETTLRETLLSAQRIADNTVAEARTKGKQLVSSAEEQARQLLAGAEEQSHRLAQDAQVAAANAKLEFENFKKSHEDYKTRFVRMVREQMAALKLDEEEVLSQQERSIADKQDSASQG